jgi:RNA polymerase sigma factor (sigma-70 family)
VEVRNIRPAPRAGRVFLNLVAPARDYILEHMDQTRERTIDELLVTRCQEGDRECFNLLIRRWQRRLWRYASGLTGSDDAAWEVTQETWMAILRQIRKLSDPAWFGAWAYRIVRNKCADYCCRANRQRHLADSLAERQKANGHSPQEGPSAAVAEALRRLPPDRQELLTLKYREDLNIIEIAVVLGIPAGTVKSRLYHAREQVRRILEGDES